MVIFLKMRILDDAMTTTNSTDPVAAAAHCIAEIELARSEVHRRELACLEVQRRFKAKLITEEDDGTKEELGDLLERFTTLIDEIRKYQHDLGTEATKMQRAKDALTAHPTSELAPAFIDFMEEDVRISRRAVTMTLYDYDELIDRLRSLEQTYE